MKVIYFGLFVEDADLPKGSLDINTVNKHITFEFRPEVYPAHLVGKTFDLNIIGEGNDGMNEGLSVDIPESILKYYKGAKRPHITLSVSKGSSPVNTGNIEFTKWSQPVAIRSTFRLFTTEGLI